MSLRKCEHASFLWTLCFVWTQLSINQTGGRISTGNCGTISGWGRRPWVICRRQKRRSFEGDRRSSLSLTTSCSALKTSMGSPLPSVSDRSGSPKSWKSNTMAAAIFRTWSPLKRFVAVGTGQTVLATSRHTAAYVRYVSKLDRGNQSMPGLRLSFTPPGIF